MHPPCMQKKPILQGALEGIIGLLTVLPTWLSKQPAWHHLHGDIDLELFATLNGPEEQWEPLHLACLCSVHWHIQQQNHCDRRREMYSYKHNSNSEYQNSKVQLAY